ncbi:MAG TPA: hypothetical protein H9915_04870 [Candidatus Gemmiger faecigallinarum]|nr:hypothetical protein [Candidatus Gemmiger faecigallinarum]
MANKKALGFYMDAVAFVLAVVGLVAMIVSSTMSTANALNGFVSLVAMAVIAAVLAAVAAIAPTRMGNFDYLGTVSAVAAVALLTVVIGSMLNERILLMSGLFSYNSANTVGWQVFYAMVVAVVCFLAAIICMIIGAFNKSVK